MRQKLRDRNIDGKQTMRQKTDTNKTMRKMAQVHQGRANGTIEIERREQKNGHG